MEIVQRILLNNSYWNCVIRVARANVNFGSRIFFKIIKPHLSFPLLNTVVIFKKK